MHLLIAVGVCLVERVFGHSCGVGLINNSAVLRAHFLPGMHQLSETAGSLHFYGPANTHGCRQGAQRGKLHDCLRTCHIDSILVSVLW